MKRRFSLICILLILVTLLSACAENPSDATTPTSITTPTAPATPAGGVIQVATDGDDTADGVTAPVKTVARALELARERIVGGDVTIDIADGTYNISEPLNITHEETDRDNGYVLTLQGHENTVISGGVSVAGWEKQEDNIWKVTLPDMDTVNGFYVNGEVMPLARLQVSGSFVDGEEKGGIVLNTKQTFSDFSSYNQNAQITKCSFTTDGSYSLTREALEAELGNIRMFFDQTFARTCLEFAEVTENNGKFTFLASGKTLNLLNGAKMADYDLTANRYYLANSYLFLDEEGEYYFDRSTKTLYYCSEASPEGSDCVVAVSEGLLNIQGMDSKLASNVRIQNLTFAYGTSDILTVNPYKQILNDTYGSGLEGDFERYLLPGQIVLDRASNLTIDNCAFIHYDTSGIALREHVYNTAITNSEIRNISGTGIVVGTVNAKNGYGIVDRNPHPEDLTNVTAVKKNSVVPAKITISGNTVENCGIESIGSNGIMVFYGYQVNVLNNTVERTGGSGISAGWGLANYTVKKEATKNSGDILIEGNKVISPCMRIVNAGGIYSMGAFFGDGLTIRSNFVDMTGAQRDSSPALYLDDGSEFVTITNNVAVGTNRWLCARALPVSEEHGVCVIGNRSGTTLMNCTVSGNYSDRDNQQKEFAPGIPWPFATEVQGAQVVIEDNVTDENWQENETIMVICNASGAK